MIDGLSYLETALLVPVVCGSVYSVLCVLAMLRFRVRGSALLSTGLPAVTILKPVHGLERRLEENLRSACMQSYPDYEVVFSLQSRDDPALSVLYRLREEFGSKRVSVIVDDKELGPNGKINNLAGALAHARHEILVISDSDVSLPPDYLRSIVAPLNDPGVAYVCTPYRAVGAESWMEKIELLTLNADFTPSVVFAYETGASGFCLGASVAFRRADLQSIGGIEALGDCLVEDYEMGRRLAAGGRRAVLTLPVVSTQVEPRSFIQAWRRHVYWDQKTRAARPVGFFATVIVRAVPFAVMFAAARMGDALGLSLLAAVTMLRIATAAIVMRWGLKDREGLRALHWLPLRDLVGLGSWVVSQLNSTLVWRGRRFRILRGGRVVMDDEAP